MKSITQSRARSPRECTNLLYEMIDEDRLDKDLVINACLSYMSEDSVKDMMEHNEFIQPDEFEVKWGRARKPLLDKDLK